MRLLSLSMNDSASRITIFALVAFTLTALLYVKTCGYQFTCVDDPEYVLSNDHMKDGLTAENIKWAFTSRSYADNWHPIAWLSMMTDVSIYRLTNGNPRKWELCNNPVSTVMHGHNVLLHALNTTLLFLLLIRFGRGRLDSVWSLLITLLWSLHPLRTEVVCWISERKELSSVFFMLLTLLVWTRPRPKAFLRLGVALPLAGLAMMAKPVAVSLPAVLLAWDWILNKRARWLEVAPFIALSTITCYMTMTAQVDPIQLGDELSRNQRLAAILGGPVTYLWQTVWPANIALLYANVRTFPWHLILPGLLLVTLIFAISILWLRRTLKNETPPDTINDPLSILAFGVAWVYVGLIPMLGIVKVAAQEHSDRYTYWIGCGAAAVSILLLCWVKPIIREWFTKLSVRTGSSHDEWPDIRKMTITVTCVILTILFYMSSCRIPVWHDAEILYRDTMAKSLHSSIVRQFAYILSIKGPDGEREAEHWLRECATFEKSPKSYLELARFLMRKPEDSLGMTLGKDTSFQEPEHLLKEILDTFPNDKEARELLNKIETYRKDHGAKK